MPALPSIDLPHVHSGKVRDIYDAGDDRLLMVTSDRMSAFDVVMAEPIPHKGRVLTAMTAFWVEHLADVMGNHLLSTDLADCPTEAQHPELAGRVMLCRQAEMLPVECIVRGRLTGSAWKEYRDAGTMHGEALPAGLQESAELPEPVFTPSTKAEVGLHDENITFDKAVDLIGAELAEQARDGQPRAVQPGGGLGRRAGHRHRRHQVRARPRRRRADPLRRGAHARLVSLLAGRRGRCSESTPPSFDKQPVRDYLETLDWDKNPPPPPLPADVVAATSARYVEAYERITGRALRRLAGCRRIACGHA